MKTKSLRRVLRNGTVFLTLFATAPGILFAQEQPRYDYPPTSGYSQPQVPAYSQQSSAYPRSQYPQAPQTGYANQQPAYASPPPPRREYVSPMEFIPTFGRRVGQMFRRVFYGDPANHPEAVPGHQGGYSLDAPPPYGSQYGAPPQGDYPQQPAQPRYEEAQPQTRRVPNSELPPARQSQQQIPQPQKQPPAVVNQPTQPQRTTPSSNAVVQPTGPTVHAPVVDKRKPQSSLPKKYTPPTVTRTEASKPKVDSQPPVTVKEKPVVKQKPKKLVDTPPQSTDDSFYPLPGDKPEVAKNSPPSTSETKKTGSTTADSSSKTSSSGNNGSFLKGRRTNKPGRVVSPYPPYQELDVTGLPSGSLAMDPTTQKVFEVP